MSSAIRNANTRLFEMYREAVELRRTGDDEDLATAVALEIAAGRWEVLSVEEARERARAFLCRLYPERAMA